MIDRTQFTKAWAGLAGRFGKEGDTGQAKLYFAFLNPQMDTDEFLAAARALWASSQFMPRPADFLMVGPKAEWTQVIACIEGYRAPDWPWARPGPDGEPSAWERLSARAKAACRQVGGMDALKAAFERDPLRAKSEWEKALEQTTAGDVMQLPAPAAPAQVERRTAHALQRARVEVPSAPRRHLQAVPNEGLSR